MYSEFRVTKQLWVHIGIDIKDIHMWECHERIIAWYLVRPSIDPKEKQTKNSVQGQSKYTGRDKGVYLRCSLLWLIPQKDELGVAFKDWLLGLGVTPTPHVPPNIRINKIKWVLRNGEDEKYRKDRSWQVRATMFENRTNKNKGAEITNAKQQAEASYSVLFLESILLGILACGKHWAYRYWPIQWDKGERTIEKMILITQWQK